MRSIRRSKENATDLFLKLRIARIRKLQGELAVFWQVVVDYGLGNQADG